MLSATYDTTASTSGSAVTSLTWSHTCTGSNLVLQVDVISGNGTTSASSVTYNGAALTSIGKQFTNNASNGFIERYILVGPTTGAHSVIVTFAASQQVLIGASISASGVSQTLSDYTAIKAFGSGATASAIVTAPATTSLVTAAACCGNSVVSSAQTQRWLVNASSSFGAGNGAGETAVGTGSNITMSFGINSDFWGLIATEIKQTSGGGSTLNGSAALSEAATLAASPGQTQFPTASLTEATTLAASGTTTKFATASLSEAATFSATSGAVVMATAALSEAATLSAGATRVQPATASLSESGTLVAAAKVIALPSAPLSEAATLSASPTAKLFAGTSMSTAMTFAADAAANTPVIVPNGTPDNPGNPYIPPMPVNTVAVDEWRAFIFNTVTGAYETELPLADIPTYNYLLNDAGGGSISIALGGADGFDRNLLDQYTDNQNWRWSAAVVYNNFILQAGPIVSENYSEGPSTSISFVGIWKLFSKRILINPPASLGTPTDPGADITYSNVTLKQLAKLILRDNMVSQGPLPIDLPDDDAAGSVSETYYGYDLNLVADVLTNLTGMSNGPEIEFRPYWQDPLHVRWACRIGGPRLGQLGSPWVYDYGERGAMVGLDKASDSSNSTSGVYTRGNGSQRSQVIGYASDLTMVNAGSPLLITVDGNHTSETSSPVLASYATADIATYKNAIRSYTGTVKLNATGVDKQPTGSPSIDLISVGDTLSAVVTGHRRLPDGVYVLRVIGVQNGDAQTAKLTLQTTS